MPSLDAHVTLSDLVVLATAIVGLVAFGVTQKVIQKGAVAKITELNGRFELESSKNATKHEENQRRLADIALQITRDYVRTDDFRRLEDRFAAKFEKLEHAVNNAGAKTAGVIKDALRDVLGPARIGRE